MTYNWSDIQKMGFEQAMGRFNNDEEVYLLYDDNAKSVVEYSSNKIYEHHKKKQ